MVAALALDQATKAALLLTAPSIAQPHEAPVLILELFGGWLTIEAGANTGLAFSTGAGLGVLAGMFVAIAGAVIVLDLALAGDVLPGRVNAALGLVLGGAVGNLIDRARSGWVLDFVRLDVPVLSRYIFNVADVAIVLGLLILVVVGPSPWLHWARAIGASRHIRDRFGERAPRA